MIKFFVSYFERPTPFRFVFKLQHHCDHCVCHVFGCNTVLPVCYPITSISANVYRYIVGFAGPLAKAPAYLLCTKTYLTRKNGLVKTV